MIIIKSPEDLKKLKKACKISADVLKYAGQEITAGMSPTNLINLYTNISLHMGQNRHSSECTVSLPVHVSR